MHLEEHFRAHCKAYEIFFLTVCKNTSTNKASELLVVACYELWKLIAEKKHMGFV
jgi:hypothetical protein